MCSCRLRTSRTRVVLLAEDVDRNFEGRPRAKGASLSSSSRRTWIEMSTLSPPTRLLKSSSSRRTWIEIICTRKPTSTAWVVLLAEDVDRNIGERVQDIRFLVVLLAEDVDRNCKACDVPRSAKKSSSSRRTWIEITPITTQAEFDAASSSSRRTWIEISVPRSCRSRRTCRPPRGGRG